ncbi:MAG: hypothetical protein WD749_14815, partial [Phycisphaerales bacterium]
MPGTATPDFQYVNRIAFAPGNPQVMLVATPAGIFRSTDSGATWTQRSTARMFQVLFHPTDASRALAGGAIPHYSLDGGVTWTAATGTWATPHRVELHYAPSDPTIVYSASSTGSQLRVYKSTNGGQSYTQQGASGISTLESYTGVLWVDPLNANTLLMGGQAMARSVNGGVNLSTTFGALHADHHVITPHPAYNGVTNKTLFFGTDGGVFRTTDSAGSAATSLNNNLGITQFYGASINPNGIVLAGAQDNFTLRYSGNPQAWTQTFGGDGGFTASGGKWYIGNGNAAGRLSVFGKFAGQESSQADPDYPGEHVFFLVDPSHQSYELIKNVIAGQMFVGELNHPTLMRV